MSSMPSVIRSFLQSASIAVVGVSRSSGEPSSLVFRRMVDAALPVVPVHPAMTSCFGRRCYPDLRSIPAIPPAALIATHPRTTLGVLHECRELGISSVWIHRSIGNGSWSPEASAFCRAHGISAIEGGCPLMFIEPVDVGHRCLRWFLQRTGRVPR